MANTMRHLALGIERRGHRIHVVRPEQAEMDLGFTEDLCSRLLPWKVKLSVNPNGRSGR